jgi:hypothetical protein
MVNTKYFWSVGIVITLMKLGCAVYSLAAGSIYAKRSRGKILLSKHDYIRQSQKSFDVEATIENCINAGFRLKGRLYTRDNLIPHGSATRC